MSEKSKRHNQDISGQADKPRSDDGITDEEWAAATQAFEDAGLPLYDPDKHLKAFLDSIPKSEDTK